MPDPIKAMEMMNQLNLGYGNEPEFKKKSMSNNPRFNPEKAAQFREALETEKEANRVLREMKRDQAIEKAREFVKEGKSAFEPKSTGGGGGGGGMGSNKLSSRDLTKNYKVGGKVSEASHKKALQKAGFYDKGKTKSEREKIVSKVTTKPQRLGMVEKLFSTKKMNSGGMASKRADGCAIKGKTRA